MRQEEYLYNNDVFRVLNDIDKELTNSGVQRRFALYSLGGTKLMIENFKNSSKDLDFIISRKDSLVLGEIIESVKKKQKVDIDVFYDGNISGFLIPDYQKRAKRVSYCSDNLDLFCLDDLAFVLTKVIAGRQRDIKEISNFLQWQNISKDALRKRFSEFVLNKNKSDKITYKVENFIRVYFDY